MDFLGAGIRYPITVDDSGRIAMSKGEENIRDSLLIILSTAKGERVMRPEFGCDIHGMVFSVVNSSTITLMKSAVQEAILQHEPRVDLLSVLIDTEELSVGVITFDLRYRVIQTNNEFNLVFPFSLTEGA